MTTAGGRSDAVPSADEVRSALGRVLSSETFRGSPQLGSFLRYVVEAKLRGEAERIKGYTIAVEALGRDDTFDPQSDPIVRVEAARLRRAIGRYYEGANGQETVRIELPLGSYVPVFRSVDTAEEGHAPPRLPAARRLPRVNWYRVAIGAALVLTGAALYALMDFWFDIGPRRSQGLIAVPAQADALPRQADAPFIVGQPAVGVK
jgi:hypothetical protein